VFPDGSTWSGDELVARVSSHLTRQPGDVAVG
jgi:hypothetical protein